MTLKVGPDPRNQQTKISIFAVILPSIVEGLQFQHSLDHSFPARVSSFVRASYTIKVDSISAGRYVSSQSCGMAVFNRKKKSRAPAPSSFQNIHGSRHPKDNEKRYCRWCNRLEWVLLAAGRLHLGCVSLIRSHTCCGWRCRQKSHQHRCSHGARTTFKRAALIHRCRVETYLKE